MQAILARFRAAPLSNGFFFAGILGFIITAIYYQYGKLDVSLAFTFMLFFAIVFIATMISMSKAPITELIKVNKNLTIINKNININKNLNKKLGKKRKKKK